MDNIIDINLSENGTNRKTFLFFSFRCITIDIHKLSILCGKRIKGGVEVGKINLINKSHKQKLYPIVE